MIKYNDRRFLTTFRELAAIGWDEKEGMDRASYGKNFLEARDYLASKMQLAGMKIWVDSVGNLHGRYEGKNEDNPAILVGSHLDAVPHGGRYDGAVGILAGLEALQSIHEAKVLPDQPLEVIAFVAEESSPLGGTFGSRAIAGLVPLELNKKAKEWSGLTVEDLREARIQPKNYQAYLELHIEQGPILERKHLSIGIPTGIVSIIRHKITLHGQANHAGTTPMSERRDAMKAAAELIADWNQWVETRLKEKDDFVTNIGVFELQPNSPAVVPEEASFILEHRSLSDAVDAEITTAFKEKLRAFSEYTPTMEPVVSKPSVLLAEEVMAAVEKASAECGLSCQRMPSGASHDAAAMAHIMPTGMIFVPSVKGISHNKEEYTSDDDLLHGLHVLGETIINLGGKA